MRQLKFRVWNGMEMIHDVTVGRFGAFYVNPMSKGNGLDEEDSASLTPFNTKYSDTTPVMQFSGVKDGKGIEIYEGDILGHPEPGRTVRFVSFEDGCFIGWSKGNEDDPSPLYTFQHWIVIGNIHEHPNLLEN